MLASVPPDVQKQMFGERLFPLISKICLDYAGKIIGMMLEIDNLELLHILESRESLEAKVKEAIDVLENYKHWLILNLVQIFYINVFFLILKTIYF